MGQLFPIHSSSGLRERAVEADLWLLLEVGDAVIDRFVLYII
jgi:hypothetical protein